MEIEIGKLYRPKDIARCGTFETRRGAVYVRFNTDTGYDILDRDKNVLTQCCSCLKAVDLISSPLSLENLQEGDMVKDMKGDVRMVIGRVGQMVFISAGTNGWSGHAISWLRENNYAPYSEEEEKVEEITVEEVCKRLGKTVKIVK